MANFKIFVEFKGNEPIETIAELGVDFSHLEGWELVYASIVGPDEDSYGNYDYTVVTEDEAGVVFDRLRELLGNYNAENVIVKSVEELPPIKLPEKPQFDIMTYNKPVSVNRNI